MNSDFFQKKIIIAVDDNPQILSTITSFLERDYKIIGATNGVSAIKAMEKMTASLFLLDIEMPGMDGYALANTIRGNVKYKRTPIIFLTSNATRDYIMTAFAYGGNDYLVKPVDRSLLLRKIQKFI